MPPTPIKKRKKELDIYPLPRGGSEHRAERGCPPPPSYPTHMKIYLWKILYI
jgi:hypothetical protein